MTEKSQDYTTMTELPSFAIARTVEDVTAAGNATKWSGVALPPKVGDVVKVKINGIGRSIVCHYFTEHGWLGLVVKPTRPPAWFSKQYHKVATCHVFGAEIE